MKFPRNARMIRNNLDAAPVASVFFCLLIFALLASLTYTPGVVIHLPTSAVPQAGVEGPVVTVALAANGQFYFRNQIIDEAGLLNRLKVEVKEQKEPLTLIVQADQAVTLEQLNHLRDVAVSAGIEQMSQQILPRVFDSSVKLKEP